MKYDISFVVPGMPFDGCTIKKGGLGGSESAAYYMALNLASSGHRVTVFSNVLSPNLVDGVNYVPLKFFKEYCAYNPQDVMISQRMPEAFAFQTASKINILWCHDLAMPQDINLIRGVAWNIDKFFLLSNFMLEQYENVIGIESNYIFKTSNGVDLSLFEESDSLVRDKNKLIYAARPERGLDNLLNLIFPKLLEKNPSYKLYIAGYENTVPQMQSFYDDVERRKSFFGDSIVNLGSLPKNELYMHYMTAGCYVYPTPSKVMPKFDEVSCISIMECQAAGLPVVTSNRGALSETLGINAGALIVSEPMSEDYVNEFVGAVFSITSESDIFDSCSKAGKAHAESFGWSDVAKKWEVEFDGILAKKTSNKVGLLRHLYVHSDIIPAKKLIAEHDFGGSSIAAKLISKIDEHYTFMEVDDGYKIQYEKIGKTHTADSAFANTPFEPRFKWLCDFIRNERLISSVVDYGCAHGSYAIHLHNSTGVIVDGIDIDKHGLDIARSLSEKHANDVSALRFRSIGEMDNVEPKDLAVVFEVLEHVPKPWETVDEVEKLVKDGGKVVITVPYGPWEFDSYEVYPHRAHIWHLDRHDLLEMFSDKKNLEIGALAYGSSIRNKAPLGWFTATYTVNGAKSNPIDIDRHMRIQSPRETLSANIMAGPNSEDQLKWSLKSYAGLCDKIVVADTGMSNAAISICKEFDAKIIKSEDPKLVGFEGPRNNGLLHCDTDWVVWIDTDEHVTDVINLNKYLRNNMYMGYSLKQHHFSVDTNFQPDIPVRVFRTSEYSGEKISWIGMIHEHPELSLNKGPGPTLVITDTAIAHTGYLIESNRMKRFSRNYPLLQKDIEKYPERILQKHFIMRDEMLLVRDELALTQGQVNDSIASRCQLVIDTYKEHFLGKNNYIGINSTQYYSDALSIMGKGLDLEFSFGFIDGKDYKGAKSHQIRYENIEDFVKDYISNVHEVTKQYKDFI